MCACVCVYVIRQEWTASADLHAEHLYHKFEKLIYLYFWFADLGQRSNMGKMEY